jgi:hypothetical protein
MSQRPTRRDWRNAEIYVQTLVEVFHLQDREVSVGRECAADSEAASVHFLEDSIVGNEIRYSTEYWDYPPERKRRTTVHEFGHIVLRPVLLAVKTFTSKFGILGDEAYGYILNAEHSVVEWFEHVIAPLVPKYPEDE